MVRVEWEVFDRVEVVRSIEAAVKATLQRLDVLLDRVRRWCRRDACLRVRAVWGKKSVREVASPVLSCWYGLVELEDRDAVDRELEWQRRDDSIDDVLEAFEGVGLVALELCGLSELDNYRSAFDVVACINTPFGIAAPYCFLVSGCGTWVEVGELVDGDGGRGFGGGDDGRREIALRKCNLLDVRVVVVIVGILVGGVRCCCRGWSGTVTRTYDEPPVCRVCGGLAGRCGERRWCRVGSEGGASCWFEQRE